MEGIEELVGLFRRSGGEFENIALGYREESGFYCYTLDSNQDTVVSCPAHLLVDIDDVGINKDGLFIANPDKYEINIKFLEKYFAFHFNTKMLDRYIEKKRQIDSLSSRDKSLISRIYPPDMCSSGGDGELEFAKKQIFRSHNILYFGRDVLMPFVTFLNHSKNGKPYHTKEEAISVSGKFSDEVFATYNMEDVVLTAGAYGFIEDTSFAYSLPMAKATPNGTTVTITRKPRESTSTDEGFRWPLIHKDRGTVTISWFPLYFEGGPLYPARVAQMVARETGMSAEGFLYGVFRANLNALVPAAFQLRESENPYARLAAAAAQRQLELIGGTRE